MCDYKLIQTVKLWNYETVNDSLNYNHTLN